MTNHQVPSLVKIAKIDISLYMQKCIYMGPSHTHLENFGPFLLLNFRKRDRLRPSVPFFSKIHMRTLISVGICSLIFFIHTSVCASVRPRTYAFTIIVAHIDQQPEHVKTGKMDLRGTEKTHFGQKTPFPQV